MSEIQVWMDEQRLAAKHQYCNTDRNGTSIPSMHDAIADDFIEKHPFLIFRIVMRHSPRVTGLTVSHQVYAYACINYH
jgi:hypothetical protein